MKKLSILLIAMSIVGIQILPAQNFMSEANAVVTLKMQGLNGSNGTAVCYNAEKEMYYAAFAGNAGFPLEMFDKYGKHLSKVETGFDVRGLWYNPKTKRLEGNAYGEEGLFYKKLNDRGYPDDNAINLIADIEVPNMNMVGTCNPNKKEIYCLIDKSVSIFKADNFDYKKSINLEIPYSSKTINSTTLLYTGVKKMEFALLDVGNKQLLVFNKKGTYIVSLRKRSIFDNKSEPL